MQSDRILLPLPVLGRSLAAHMVDMHGVADSYCRVSSDDEVGADHDRLHLNPASEHLTHHHGTEAPGKHWFVQPGQSVSIPVHVLDAVLASSSPRDDAGRCGICNQPGLADHSLNCPWLYLREQARLWHMHNDKPGE